MMGSTRARQQVIYGPQARGPGFHVRQVDYRPGYSQAPHAHDTTSVTLVFDGGFRETAHGREEQASALSVVVKPAGTVHADVVGPRGARTVLVEIHDEAAVLGPAAELGRWRWLHAGPGVRPLLALRRALIEPVGADPEELLSEALAELVGDPGPPERPAPPWVRRAREAVDDCAPAAIRVGDLARLMNVHPVALTRAFRRAYGVSVTAYRRRVRLRRAVAEVVACDRAIGSIAHGSGYADQAHLCREVRGATGLTPTCLRRIARG